jgi:hypothetical protein
MPRADTEAFFAQKFFGRYIYLTRLGIATQAVHQLLSLDSRFDSLTNGAMAFFVASLAWFVTIQFYALVVPNPEYQKEVKLWEERGVPFKMINNVTHVPPLFVACVDLVLCKDRSALELGVAPALLMAFSVFYVCHIFANFATTGYFPYAFLKEYGLSPKKWFFFVLKQQCILAVFAGANLAIVKILPQFW